MYWSSAVEEEREQMLGRVSLEQMYTIERSVHTIYVLSIM